MTKMCLFTPLFALFVAAIVHAQPVPAPGPGRDRGAAVVGRTITAEQATRRMAEVPGMEGLRPAQLRVIWLEDPATSATISWSTQHVREPQRVRYDTESRGGDVSAYRYLQVANHSGPYDGADVAYFHHARLERLKPGTTYYFVMQSEENVSPEYHFVTAPDDTRPFAVLYGGDSRSDNLARSRINITMAGMLERDPNIFAVIHGGDYIPSGRSWPQWNEWMSHHTLVITSAGRVLPIIPARGNHDGGELFNQVFAYPGGGLNYFVTRLSPLATVVTLNSEISTAGDQKRWADEQLKDLRKQTPWLMTQYHRPAFPAVKSPSTVRQNLVPLFEKHDVDLVMEADGHCIKRTVPIRDGRVDETGVIYIGEGGFGVPQRTPDNLRWYLRSPGMVNKGHHITRLDFTPERLRMRVIGLEGEIIDDHTLSVRPDYTLEKVAKKGEQAVEREREKAAKPGPNPAVAP